MMESDCVDGFISIVISAFIVNSVHLKLFCIVCAAITFAASNDVNVSSPNIRTSVKVIIVSVNIS